MEVVKAPSYNVPMYKSTYDTNGDGKVNSADTADTATTANNALKIGGRTIYVSTADPSGGVNGDLWFKYTP